MKTTFSALWSEQLGQAIVAATPPAYHATFNYVDAQLVLAAVNQGIDSRLQACYVPARGDDFVAFGGKLECFISPTSLAVLVRRLMETEDERAQDLAMALCSSIDIELV